MDKKTVYQKEYKIRMVGDGGIEVTIPKVVVERAARKAGMSLLEFIQTHKIVHLFNDFTDFDAAYRFAPIESPLEEIEVPQIS